MARVSFIDRPWTLGHKLESLGPAKVPSTQQVRSGFRQIAESFPDHPLVSRFDAGAMEWRRVPPRELNEHLHTIIVDGEVDSGSLHDQLPIWFDKFEPTLPLKVVLGERSVTLMTSHALSDGRSDMALLERLFSCREEPRKMLDLVGPSADRATLTALADFYGRRPSNIMSLLRSPRPAPTCSVEEEVTKGFPSFVYGRIDRPTWSGIKKWRRDHFPEVSLASVLFSLICQAFASSCPGVDDSGFFLVVDNRRYLPGRVPLSGNMAKSTYVRPDDLANPAAVHRAICETLASGRTLAGAAISAANFERERRRIRRTGAGLHRYANNTLSISYVNHLEPFDSLPWLGGEGERWMVGIATASNCSVLCFNMGGELHLTAFFGPDRLHEADVRKALEVIQAGPDGARKQLTRAS